MPVGILLSYLRFSSSLSPFQSIFVSFVAISSGFTCRCFKDRHLWEIPPECVLIGERMKQKTKIDDILSLVLNT